ncbi:M16 family metallopeptidase [Pedobacter psychroterrae]|uniref:Insulinase family protein n=1 Tax=Pedobacter psychroterrae TaxID=2530453 RepID=A0A4R0NL87_9SPHI|nr:M16 family metallopeptidase [Pedobacter psychroterrae]TCD01386.1 insulinase family protein [Pedobacter psychroterrae]
MKSYIKKITLAIGLSLLTFSQLLAQELPLNPEVTRGKLPNGFTYYVQKNTNHKKRVTLYLVNKVGSILETEEQRGLAHFMEHMSFNGSTHFPGATLVDFLEKAGVRFGADLNAYTSFDETVYQLPIPIDKPEMLNSGLQVIRDWAAEATLDPKEIDKERGVVLEEKRLRNGGQQRIQQQTFPYMVNHSRYADREPIGTEAVLKNFTRETILSFYKDWYRPDLQAIIVVGDVDVKDIVQRIHKLFSDLKAPAVPKPRPEYTIELSGKNQFLAVTDKEVQGTMMQIMIKHPHKKLLTHADYMDYIKMNLFNQVLAARFQSVSQKNASRYIGVSAGLAPFMANVEAFTANLSARPGELEKGFAAFWSEISKIKDQGFTAAELDLAKMQYLNGMQAMASEGDKKQSAQYAQEYVRHFLNGNAIPGITKEAELTEAYLPAISLGHINQMAKQYISEVNRDVVIIGPETAKAGLPNEHQVNEWFAKYGTTTAPAANAEEEKAVLALAKMPMIAVPPVKGKVVSSTKIKELNLTELKLSNGVRVILKPTTFKNDEVSFTAFSPGGTSIYSDADFQTATNAASLIVEGGIGDFNGETLRQKLNGKQAGANPFIGERIEGISGYSNAKELETALQLTYLYFTEPRKDTAAFTATMSRAKATLANPINTPEKMFGDTLTAVMSNYHLRMKSPTLADLEKINLDRAFEIYKERFNDASDFTFIIVGNFDPVKIRPLLEQYLGSLPATGRKESAKDLGIQIPSGVIKKTIYSGAEDKATVQLIISGNYEYSEAHNMQLQAIKQVLELRMLERLREKEGGVYSPSVSLNVSHSPRTRYAFGISFGCSPANVEMLIAAVWQEIAKIKAEGAFPEDLAKFKAEKKVGMTNALETNGFWLNYLSNQYQEQLDPKDILNYTKNLENLNGAALKTAINTYLDGKNYVRVVLLPDNQKVIR